MVARNYSSVAADTELSTGINNTDTSLTVDDATGWPAAPFILVIEPGGANEELILVGAKASNVFSSLTRGFDSSTAVSHSAGAVIKHAFVAADARLVYTHDHAQTGDHATVSHDDLDDLTTGDPHTQYATTGELSDHEGDSIDDGAHGITDMTVVGVDMASAMLSALTNLTASYQTAGTIAFTLPAGWNSAEITVEAFVAFYAGSGTSPLYVKVGDGTTETEDSISHLGLGEIVPMPVVHAQTVTGNKSFTTQVKQTGAGTSHVRAGFMKLTAIKKS